VPRFTSSTIGSYTGKWLLITAVFEVALASFFVALGLFNSEARFGMVLTAGILGLVAVILGGIGLRIRRRAAEVQRLIATGLPGTATVTGLTQTGMFLNENPQVEMELMVQLPGRPPYAAKRKEFVPLILLNRVSTGAVLAVKVDPADPNDVVIDWEAPAPAPSETAQGWWGVPAPAPAAVGAGTETLQEVQTALAGSGLQSERPFSEPGQGGYTVEQLRAHLRANGLSGTATIDRLEDTGKDVGTDHLFIMQTTTTVPGYPPHKGEPSAAMVPKEKVGRVYVGATLPVKVAPDNFDAVMFEWDKI
jgi:hypothetical protein